MNMALVLAGGGVAGIAWETGVLRGIEDVDAVLARRLVGADTVVGTSAGATVAAQITSGRSLTELYDDQVGGPSAEIDIQIDIDDLIHRFAEATAGASSPEEMRRAIGAMALAARTVEEPVRRAVIEGRLPGGSWPSRDLRITAVEAETGELVVFDRNRGVHVVDAVAASCAVPGIWPPVTIGAHRYIDGGVRSLANADLVAGCDPVVVVSPADPDLPGLSGRPLADELRALEPARVVVIAADGDSTAAFGTNPLAVSTRKPSAEAGRAQGRREAGRLADLL
jgi:NTE family protein